MNEPCFVRVEERMSSKKRGILCMWRFWCVQEVNLGQSSPYCSAIPPRSTAKFIRSQSAHKIPALCTIRFSSVDTERMMLVYVQASAYVEQRMSMSCVRSTFCSLLRRICFVGSCSGVISVNFVMNADPITLFFVFFVSFQQSLLSVRWIFMLLYLWIVLPALEFKRRFGLFTNRLVNKLWIFLCSVVNVDRFCHRS